MTFLPSSEEKMLMKQAERDLTPQDANSTNTNLAWNRLEVW